MKRFLPLLSALLVAASTALLAFAPDDAAARRLGGGGSAGLQRSLPARPAAPAQTAPKQAQEPAQQPPQQAAAPQTPPRNAQQAAPATPQAPAAQPPRRPWLAPLAGLAAGLGLAALASHFGFGEALANVMTVLLLLVVGVVVVRFVMARLRRRDLGYAGAGAPQATQASTTAPFGASSSMQAGSTTMPAVAALQPAPQTLALPADFDAAAFEKIAKLIFIRLQAANDAGDLQDLRRFTTPEMYAAARLDLQNRVPGRHQRTDVVKLAAEIVDVSQEDGRDVISVRYSGLLREEDGGVAEPFDEVWHLVRPTGAAGADWAIAGIQQAALA